MGRNILIQSKENRLHLFFPHLIFFKKIWDLILNAMFAEWFAFSFHIMYIYITAWKVPLFGDFLVRIFQHLDWILRDTPYLSLFTPNEEKYGPKKFEYEHFSRSVSRTESCSFSFIYQPCLLIYRDEWLIDWLIKRNRLDQETH